MAASTPRKCSPISQCTKIYSVQPLSFWCSTYNRKYRRAALAVGRKMVQDFHRSNAEVILSPESKFLERHSATYKTKFVVGHAKEAIVNTAKSMKADFIVVGSHVHGAFGAFLLGSVAQKVRSSSRVPVLVIR
jgi:nucleotide-binding universal stress UspA family protein